MLELQFMQKYNKCNKPKSNILKKNLEENLALERKKSYFIKKKEKKHCVLMQHFCSFLGSHCC